MTNVRHLKINKKVFVFIYDKKCVKKKKIVEFCENFILNNIFVFYETY